MLKAEIAELDAREQELDRHKQWVQQSIKNVTDDVSNHQYPFKGLNAMYCINFGGLNRPIRNQTFFFFACHIILNVVSRINREK